MNRRSKLYELSGSVIDYLVNQRGMSQSTIAEMLQLDKSFISRVRNRERELSNANLEKLADALNVELGVLLIESTKPKNPVTPEKQKLFDLCSQLMKQADEAIAQIKASGKSSKR